MANERPPRPPIVDEAMGLLAECLGRILADILYQEELEARAKRQSLKQAGDAGSETTPKPTVANSKPSTDRKPKTPRGKSRAKRNRSGNV